MSVAGIGLIVCFLVMASLYITIKLWHVVEKYAEKNDQKFKEILETLKRIK